MEPWFAPRQIITALGITLPVFIYYAYKIYDDILTFNEKYNDISDLEWIPETMDQSRNLPENRRIDEICEIIKEDIYPIIIRLFSKKEIIMFIGYIGTLLGVLSSFAALHLSVGSSGMDPGHAISNLMRGGLSTALISSLLAGIIILVLSHYLSTMTSKIMTMELGAKHIAWRHLYPAEDVAGPDMTEEEQDV